MILFSFCIQLLHADQRHQRMSQQLRDMRAQGVGTTGAGEHLTIIHLSVGE